MEFLRNLWLPGNRVCLHLPIFSHAVVAGAQCPKYYCEIFFAYLSSYNTSSFKMVFQAMFPAVNSSRIWWILKLFHVSLGNCNGSKLVGLKYFLLSFTSEVLTIFSPVFYSFARRCNNVYLAEETSLVNIKFVKIQIPAF